MYGIVVLLHVLGAFAFVLAHGISILASFRLRSERDRARQAQLLELSGLGVGLMYIGLAVMLVAGIAAGFLGDHWGRAWIWAALGLLVVVIAVMYAVATPFYGRMRAAAGVPGSEQMAARLKPPASPADLEALATSNRPMLLAAVGGIGLVIIIWLMLAKPF
jgi:cytochrome c-type biogenesis protein CcmH/NrfG